MHIEIIAIMIIGLLVALRAFISLVDGYYRATLEIRRALNLAREHISAELARRAAKAAEGGKI